MTKEEKKDEMKNRISMALKDTILQQGFEIICKNVAELETENNKLLDVINNQDVKIADLEKENAELKGLKDVATLIRANNDTVVTLMQLNNKLVSKSQQLTRAKEIIALGLRVCETSSIEYMNLYQKQAEQFLNGDGCPDCLCEDCIKEDCTVRKLGLVEK